ncbi:MAG TPA: hypothetical protein VLG40_02915 [Candidatus Saccharimonas sp.]|nr:hypothetical protein [Candidatus Saccharimonas sp.]
MRTLLVNGFVTVAFVTELSALARRHGVTIHWQGEKDIRIDEALKGHLPGLNEHAFSLLYRYDVILLSGLARFSFEDFMRIVCSKKRTVWTGAYTLALLELMDKHNVSFSNADPHTLLARDIFLSHVSTRCFNCLRSYGIVSYAMLPLLSDNFLLGRLKNFGEQSLIKLRQEQAARYKP